YPAPYRRCQSDKQRPLPSSDHKKTGHFTVPGVRDDLWCSRPPGLYRYRYIVITGLAARTVVETYSSSTNVSSRFLRIDGSATNTTRNIATANSDADSGRSTKVMKSPRDNSSARRKFSSIMGPSTRPKRSGAPSHFSLDHT